MPAPRPAAQVPATPSFNFIAGTYSLSQWHIPYFATTMTFRQAAQNLKLVSDFPGAERLRWRLEELYQRDVDWPRVERQILPYLRSDEHPQFFNSLTVALLPIMGNEVLERFDGDGWAPPGAADSSLTPHTLSVGGISFSYYSAWNNLADPSARLGQVRWNPDEIFSVAIDGQHRLAAIKKLVETGADIDRLNRTDIPVIVIVLDPRVGFRGPNSRLVDLLRRLFTDLNKHAVKVDRTRQILLDDVDPHSLCVRTLVESIVSDGSEALERTPPQLPLSIVDWHTGEAKVDKGPYLTTILGLDWAVTKLLGAKPIRDYMDYREVSRQLDAFERSIGVQLTDAKTRLQDLRQYNFRPFAYRNDEVEGVASAFARVWAPALISLFTRFSSYSQLLTLRRTQGTLIAEFVNWYYLYFRKEKEAVGGTAKREYEQMLTHLMNRADRPRSEVELKNQLEEIQAEKENCLAFNVVFQRAFVEAFVLYQKVSPADLAGDEVESADELFDDTDAQQEDGADGLEPTPPPTVPENAAVTARVQQVAAQVDLFLESANRMPDADPQWLQHTFPVGAGTHRKYFWLGALLSADQTIDFTLGASSRSAELILWGPLVALDRRQDGIAAAGTFEAFWDKLNDENRDFTAAQKALRRSLDRYRKATADRILRAAHDDFDELSEERCNELRDLEVKPRLKWVWKAMGD